MKKLLIVTTILLTAALIVPQASTAFFGGKFETLKPQNGELRIPLKDIDNGEAHYFKVKASDGIMVAFFTLKSRDGVIRAAIDACDVCYRAGKGYVQAGDFMVCENCGQRFPSARINVVKGGCNPAPLERTMQGQHLVIKMSDIDKNSWYNQYKKL